MSVRPSPVHVQRAPTSSYKSRKLPQVYVLVPRSPYDLAKSEAIGTRTTDRSYPPTPLRAHNMASTNSPSTAIKRKRSEGTVNEAEQRAPDTKSKRQKLSTVAPKPQGATKSTRAAASSATPEFPNGFFYCHQCNKKRDSSVGLYCTYRIKTPHTLARCKAKYCRPCLKNRYGQDLDEIKDRGIDVPSQESAGHDQAQGYIFKCPRCLGNCNCRGCRKAMGLEPTGNLTLAAKKTGADSVAVMLDSNVKMIGILPGKGRQIPDPPRRKVPKPPKVPTPVLTTTAPKPRRSIIRKPKPLPRVLWFPVPVPLSFTLDRALPRMAIREFALRFGKLLDISRAHLEELEEIGGRRSHEVDDDDDGFEQDVDVEMGWVGETCLRAIFLGLLSLLLSNQPGYGKQEKKAIQDAIQEIKASRANLSRMWGALAGLRAEFAKVNNEPIFPDPLAPPQHTKIHTTRSGVLTGAGMNVTTTAQLVPVVLPLIEMVLESQALRDEFEEGAKEAKERAKEEKERVKALREQWEGTKRNNPDKAARAEFKRSLSALEQAQRVAIHAYAPRFAPLGTDHEGRIYFALTPSMAEREAAAALLAGDTAKGGKAQGRAIVSVDERSGLRRWGWFVAVWGKKPSDGLVPADDDDDLDVERWWGIWQPDEVRKLADWIAIKNGMAEGKRLNTKGRDRDEQAASGPNDRERSAASTGTSSSRKTGGPESRSGALSGDLTPLSDASDTEDEPVFDSSLSSVSGDESDGEGNGDDDKVQMRVDGGARALPSQNEIKALVKALIEYAEVLDWRVWRMQDERGRDGRENAAAKDKDKNKAVGSRIRGVSPASFYGTAA